MIKTRANFKYFNPYKTAEEAIEELDNHFGIYDKITKANAELQDPKFAMGVVNKNETFEEFYTRFTSTIAPLKLSEAVRIINLTRLLTTRLRYRLTGMVYKNFRDIVEFVRKLDMDLRLVDNTTTRNDKKDNKKGQSSGGGGGSNQDSRPPNSRNNSKTTSRRGYTYPQQLMDRLRKEERCFKCLKPGHRSGDNDAPCKNADPLNKEQVEVMLKTAGIEFSEDESPEPEPKN